MYGKLAEAVGLRGRIRAGQQGTAAGYAGGRPCCPARIRPRTLRPRRASRTCSFSFASVCPSVSRSPGVYPAASTHTPDQVLCLSSPPSDRSPVAQLAEHATVNRRVSGSSPLGGALPAGQSLETEADQDHAHRKLTASQRGVERRRHLRVDHLPAHVDVLSHRWPSMAELVRDRPGRQARLIQDRRTGLPETCDVTHVKPAVPRAVRRSREVLLGSRQPPSASGKSGPRPDESPRRVRRLVWLTTRPR